jgi:hypothetical protein
VDNDQLKLLCPMCEKEITLREDTRTDENGKGVHTDCYMKRILQINLPSSGTAAQSISNRERKLLASS